MPGILRADGYTNLNAKADAFEWALISRGEFSDDAGAETHFEISLPAGYEHLHLRLDDFALNSVAQRHFEARVTNDAFATLESGLFYSWAAEGAEYGGTGLSGESGSATALRFSSDDTTGSLGEQPDTVLDLHIWDHADAGVWTKFDWFLRTTEGVGATGAYYVGAGAYEVDEIIDGIAFGWEFVAGNWDLGRYSLWGRVSK